MKVNFNNYDGIQVFTCVSNELKKYWGDLCSIYHIDNAPLFVVTIADFLNAHVMCIPDNNEQSLKDTVVSTMEKYTDNMATTVCNTTTDGRINQHVVIFVERLLRHIVESLDNLDVLINMYRVVLKHEMGHIIDNNATYEKFPDNSVANDYMSKEKQAQNDMWNEIRSGWEKFPELDEFHKAYHSLPIEKRADSCVGLTWKDFADAERAYDENMKRVKGVCIE